MSHGMSRTRRWIAIGTAVVFAVALTPNAPATDEDEWKVKWANGFKVESADQKFKLRFGGRAQAD